MGEGGLNSLSTLNFPAAICRRLPQSKAAMTSQQGIIIQEMQHLCAYIWNGDSQLSQMTWPTSDSYLSQTHG